MLVLVGEVWENSLAGEVLLEHAGSVESPDIEQWPVRGQVLDEWSGGEVSGVLGEGEWAQPTLGRGPTMVTRGVQKILKGRVSCQLSPWRLIKNQCCRFI